MPWGHGVRTPVESFTQVKSPSVPRLGASRRRNRTEPLSCHLVPEREFLRPFENVVAAPTRERSRPHLFAPAWLSSPPSASRTAPSLVAARDRGPSARA